jgi:signal recognition particle subunit SRP54
MFESITRRFTEIVGSLTRKKITETNVRETIREIRRALLEADVALEVIQSFLATVETEALGERVLKGVNPGQQFIYIVFEELVKLMSPVAEGPDSRGSVTRGIAFRERGPTVILMAGLQGSGKTTTCAKLALKLRDEMKRRPLLVAGDLQRPAAVDQLKTLGEQIGVPVFSELGLAPPVVCKHGVAGAPGFGCDTVILDTAGRLHIDEEMMAEVREVARLCEPQEVFLVCDAMVGQDAVRSAREFNAQLELTGVILTKLDGDARGGAALSVKAVTGKPIRYIGVGEKLEGTLEDFHADRMAQRILGFGDTVGIVEKARQAVDQDEAARLQEELLKGTFTLEDFLKNLRAVKKMGSLKGLLGMLPGLGGYVDQIDVEDKDLLHIEAIIQSMNPKERRRPEILNTSRRDRIAKGCGLSRVDVDDLLKQFQMMKKVMDQIGRGSGKGPLGKVKALAQAKKKMSDIGTMMNELAQASQKLDGAPQRGQKKPMQRRINKDELKARRKRERQNRRQNRRR